jgi:hypothetical protein
LICGQDAVTIDFLADFYKMRRLSGKLGNQGFLRPPLQAKAAIRDEKLFPGQLKRTEDFYTLLTILLLERR